MKVAIFFSGRINNSDITSDIFKNTFLDIEYDIYASINQFNDEKSLENFKILYNPKKIFFYDWTLQENFKKIKVYVVSNIFNASSMFYANKKNVEEIILLEKYDLIIKYRTDIITKDKIDLKNIEKGFLYVPKLWNWGGINDQIGIGDEEVMKIYSNCYDYINEYCESNEFHPESLLKKYLEINEVKVKYFDFDYKLYEHRKK